MTKAAVAGTISRNSRLAGEPGLRMVESPKTAGPTRSGKGWVGIKQGLAAIREFPRGDSGEGRGFSLGIRARRAREFRTNSSDCTAIPANFPKSGGKVADLVHLVGDFFPEMGGWPQVARQRLLCRLQ